MTGPVEDKGIRLTVDPAAGAPAGNKAVRVRPAASTPQNIVQESEFEKDPLPHGVEKINKALPDWINDKVGDGVLEGVSIKFKKDDQGNYVVGTFKPGQIPDLCGCLGTTITLTIRKNGIAQEVRGTDILYTNAPLPKKEGGAVDNEALEDFKHQVLLIGKVWKEATLNGIDPTRKRQEDYRQLFNSKAPMTIEFERSKESKGPPTVTQIKAGNITIPWDSSNQVYRVNEATKKFFKVKAQEGQAAGVPKEVKVYHDPVKLHPNFQDPAYSTAEGKPSFAEMALREETNVQGDEKANYQEYLRKEIERKNKECQALKYALMEAASLEERGGIIDSAVDYFKQRGKPEFSIHKAYYNSELFDKRSKEMRLDDDEQKQLRAFQRDYAKRLTLEGEIVALYNTLLNTATGEEKTKIAEQMKLDKLDREKELGHIDQTIERYGLQELMNPKSEPAALHDLDKANKAANKIKEQAPNANDLDEMNAHADHLQKAVSNLEQQQAKTQKEIDKNPDSNDQKIVTLRAQVVEADQQIADLRQKAKDLKKKQEPLENQIIEDANNYLARAGKGRMNYRQKISDINKHLAALNSTKTDKAKPLIQKLEQQLQGIKGDFVSNFQNKCKSAPTTFVQFDAMMKDYEFIEEHFGKAVDIRSVITDNTAIQIVNDHLPPDGSYQQKPYNRELTVTEKEALENEQKRLMQLKNFLPEKGDSGEANPPRTRIDNRLTEILTLLNPA